MTTTSIRVSKETFDKIQSIIDKANQKEFGKPVKPDDAINLAISLLNEEHINTIRESTLSNIDRIERAYVEHSKSDANMTKDAFFGLVMSGKVKIK